MSAPSAEDLRDLALGKAVGLRILLQELVKAEGKAKRPGGAAAALDRIQEVIAELRAVH